jgi:hypothetical protein
MQESRWRGELKAAASDEDVLDVARRYVASLAVGHIVPLPRELTPETIETCEEVAEWALKLVQASLTFGRDETAVQYLRDVSEFFAAASARLSELQNRPRSRN